MPGAFGQHDWPDISHYRVTTLLGAGGMGEFNAMTPLGRDVALKILRKPRAGRAAHDRSRRGAGALTNIPTSPPFTDSKKAQACARW
jgi:hypothetical protein